MNRLGRPPSRGGILPRARGRHSRLEDAPVSHLDELDELEGFLGEEKSPSPHTRRVAELLRMPGAAERWRQRCQESFRESRQRHELHKAWQKGREEYLSRAWSHRTARRRKPPAEGWELVQDRVFSSKGRKTKRWVEAWVPPEFGDGREPYAGGPLPFSSRHTLSLADCYFVLALVHDAERRGPGRINPFPPEDVKGLNFYDAQLSHVCHLSASDQLTLEDCLARVEADLCETGQGQKAGPGRDQSGEGQAEGAEAERDQGETGQGEGTGTARSRAGRGQPEGSTNVPEEQAETGGGTPPDLQERIRRLQPHVKKAYCAYKYAELKSGKDRLEDSEALNWLREHGIPDKLEGYELPTDGTWKRYLGRARHALSEQKYESRKGRSHGGSIVEENQIERQADDQ
jgi:hypothetical protein